MSHRPYAPERGYLPYPAAVPYRTEIVVPDPYRSSVVHLVLAWTGAALTLGYLLPWAIAATRNRPNSAAVAVINFLLGWTVVGWVAALVMACWSNRRPPVVVTHTYLPPSSTRFVVADPGQALASSRATPAEPTVPLPVRPYPTDADDPWR